MQAPVNLGQLKDCVYLSQCLEPGIPRIPQHKADFINLATEMKEEVNMLKNQANDQMNLDHRGDPQLFQRNHRLYLVGLRGFPTPKKHIMSSIVLPHLTIDTIWVESPYSWIEEVFLVDAI